MRGPHGVLVMPPGQPTIGHGEQGPPAGCL